MSSYAQVSKASQQPTKPYVPQQDGKITKARIKSVAQDEIRAREHIHKSRKLLATSLVILVASMAAIIAFNAFVSSAQVRLDIAERQLNQAVIANQSLNLEKANLQSPERIMSIAIHQLGMTAPPSIIDLNQVNPYQGSSVGATTVGRDGQKSNVRHSKAAKPTTAKSSRLIAHSGR